MIKPNCIEIRQAAEQILSQQQHKGDTCFLTVYQLASIMNDKNCTLKGGLSVGGRGEGSETNDSLAKHIAHCLAKDDRFERQWFSADEIDSFTFCDGSKPSSKKFSMFRLKPESLSHDIK